MDLGMSPHGREVMDRLVRFMDEEVFPNESVYREQRLTLGHGNHDVPQIVHELRTKAKAADLWNLWLPDLSGLTNVEYAQMAELMGRAHRLGPVVFNCAAPDTGNMELLHRFGTPEQKRDWLEPLLDARIRSGFAMTEPDVASSDGTNIATRIDRDGDAYVVNGHKWYISGTASPDCKLLVVMGRTGHDGPRHRQHSMILVPVDAPGVEIVRPLPVLGIHEQHGHCEIRLTDVRVPLTNLLGQEGAGFSLSQARLGPGRVHHCMRAIGAAERAIDLACERALSRVARGKPLAKQGTVRADIAQSRIEIDATRLLVLRTAWLIDTVGGQQARAEISAIKVAAANMACRVIDRAIQIHGAAGLSDTTPLSELYAHARALRLIDGPDEVHVDMVARHELAKHEG